MAERRPTSGRKDRPENRTRRRFVRRQWGRRWLTLRYVAAALVLVLLVGLAIYAVFFSSWLRTEGVQVVGLDQLRERQVVQRAHVPLGEPLAREDLHAIELRVESFPIVKSADVSRSWPHRIRIEITERTPVAVIARGEKFVQIDADGVSFPPLLKASGRLPTIQAGAGADAGALREGARVAAALPAQVSRLVDHVDVSTIDRIVLFLHDGRHVMWGSSEDSTDKSKVLLSLLRTKARTIDVSVPGLPATR